MEATAKPIGPYERRSAEVHEWDPRTVEVATRVGELIREHRPDLTVEHIGSTAVPGLGAKPIIDILVGAPSLAHIEACIPALRDYGYRYVPEFEKALPQRRYFTRTDGHPGNFHVHAVVQGSDFWRTHLAFRDALRADPALAADYWKLKQRLAARFPDDRAAYTDGKSDFIRGVLARQA